MNFKGFMLFLGIRAILGNVAKRPISCFLQEGACGYKMKAEAIFFSSEWGNAFHEPANTKHRSQTAQQALASFPTYSLRRGVPSANLGTSPERYLCVRHMKKIFRLFAGENRTCVVKGWQQLCAVARAFIPIGYRQPNRPAERDLLRKRRAAA